MFPPSLINPDQPPKSHRNKNPDIADQPRSQQEKKKKKNPYQPDQNLDIAAIAAARRFLHRWST